MLVRDGEVLDRGIEFDGFRHVTRRAASGTADTEPVVVLGGSSQDGHRLDDPAQDMAEQLVAPAETGTVRRRAAVARLVRQRFAALGDRRIAVDITPSRTAAHPSVERARTCPAGPRAGVHR
ncbi:hypothetical protein [Streptomyces tropicalis]|uniref:Uncharacterized protein n=1 Tax=Streptomyces tropicalis TaxID=3034234 RepID=A0ABT6A2G5_9ACTN|nr:hypothetical protein [Streptomyces tropicalis]MDF3298843.1 hypothetical protein [Streptomyces tropicalis]